MAVCEKLEKCPFYNDKMDINKGVGAMYKKKYCEGDKTICARYIVATKLGAEFVTNNLYPNMNDAANKLLAEHKK
jgi:hypothetical protein